MMRHWIGGICLFIMTLLPAAAQQPFLISRLKDTTACRQWVDKQMGKMTLKQKIGQLIIHTVAPVASQKNKKNIEAAIKEYGIGGVLFSRGNLHAQLQLTNYAQSLASVPLLVTLDGEWGLAMRLRNTPEFPRNRVLGCIRNDSLLYAYGLEVARQCRAIGVQVNFAPVADVDNNPNNPVINVRSFGSDPKEVAHKVVAYVRGLEAGGVMAVCKHFPGHGDTGTDSHKALPELNFDRQRLDSVELYPFRQAIAAGVDGIMVGHLHVPELGKKPASISTSVISRTLKDSMNFSGLVFTDALEMRGISDNEHVCAQALIAGNDLLLAPRNLKQELAGIMEAIHKGYLTEQMIDEKCRKVLTYKYALGLQQTPPKITANADEHLFTPATMQLISQLQEAAVTVVKDSDDILPLDPSLSGTALLTIAPSMSDVFPFYKMMRESIPLNWVHAHPDSLNALATRLRPAQRVIMAVYASQVDDYLPLMKQLATDKPTILICFNDLKTLQRMDAVVEKASSVVLVHAADEGLQRYTARIVLGKGRVDGRLSVGIDATWHAGAGVTLDPEHPRNYKPEDFNMNSHILARIDSIATEGIRKEAFPGCHILVMRNGYPVYNKHFGQLTYQQNGQAVGEHTMYDLASVSKITGTLLAVMKLYDEGRFGLTDKVSHFVPELLGTDKENITVQDLLYHESGLPAYLPFYQNAIDLKSCKGGLFRKKPDARHALQVDNSLYACTDFAYKPEYVSRKASPEYPWQVADSLFVNDAFRKLILQDIVHAPLKGHDYRYSCLNFMLLKEMVECIANMPMDAYLDSVFYKPMGLSHTAYLPLRHFQKSSVAPTVAEDFLRGPLQGFVHDEAAAFMGGVSGNAGLFSTARDVARIAQLWLNRGVYGDRRYLSRATCELFITLKSKNSRRGLGFDKPDTEHPDKSPCAPSAPASVFGHTGFTGTCLWMDPDNELIYVFLSNRTYPRPFDHKNLSRMNIRESIQSIIYQSLAE